MRRRKRPVFQVFEDANHEWRWRLKDVDGSVIARSVETFETARAAEDDAKETKRQLANAPIAEEL